MQINLQPSAIHRYLVLLSHLFVAMLVLFSGLVWFLKVVAIGLVFFSYFIAENKRKSAMQYTRISVQQERVLLVDDNEKEVSAVFKGEILSSPWLIVMDLQIESPQRPNKLALALFLDSMHPEDWRDLRVKLRTLPMVQKQ